MRRGKGDQPAKYRPSPADSDNRFRHFVRVVLALGITQAQESSYPDGVAFSAIRPEDFRGKFTLLYEFGFPAVK
jgi:hypothetical protein